MADGIALKHLGRCRPRYKRYQIDDTRHSYDTDVSHDRYYHFQKLFGRRSMFTAVILCATVFVVLGLVSVGALGLLR